VYAFVSAKDLARPMFRFLKKLDEDLGDDGLLVAVWLTDDADKAKEYLPKISQYFPERRSPCSAKTAGPKDWAINPDAHLTAVVAQQGPGGEVLRLHVAERNQRPRGAPGPEEGDQEMKGAG